MRILFLEFNSNNNGGTERMTSYIANGLHDKGYDVYVASILNGKNATRFFPLNNEIPSFYLTKLSRNNRITRAQALRQIIIENKIDYVISVSHITCELAVSAIRNTNAKLILWEHYNLKYRLYKHSLTNYFFSKIYRSLFIKHIDKIVVLTNKDKKNYETMLHAKQEIAVIHNPAFRKQHSYDIKSKTIISCGWLRYVKGFDTAIKVAANVLPKHPDWKWVVYGREESPKYAKHLKELISECGLEQQFLLAGATDEMDKKYAESSFYVMTSRYEGLPMVLLEAKSHGLPLVSFDIKTGPNEIIQNNVNGYLIEPENVDAMSEKIEYLICHPEIRQQFSDKSQLDMEKFDYDNIISKWCDLLC